MSVDFRSIYDSISLCFSPISFTRSTVGSPLQGAIQRPSRRLLSLMAVQQAPSGSVYDRGGLGSGDLLRSSSRRNSNANLIDSRELVSTREEREKLARAISLLSIQNSSISSDPTSHPPQSANSNTLSPSSATVVCPSPPNGGRPYASNNQQATMADSVLPSTASSTPTLDASKSYNGSSTLDPLRKSRVGAGTKGGYGSLVGAILLIHYVVDHYAQTHI